jgi:hypothetical protein
MREREGKGSGVARGVYVGSSAPNPYTSAPTLYLILCSFIACQLIHRNYTCIHFHYTATACNKYAGSYIHKLSTWYITYYIISKYSLAVCIHLRQCSHLCLLAPS